MFTLAQLRQVRYGQTLQQGDVDYANELLIKFDQDQVMEFVRSWAQQYVNDMECESKQAEEFEQNAYGRD